MEHKRIAIIDLGTNTFNLLIAEKTSNGIRRIVSTKDGVALGLGGINENRISPEAMERGMITLEKFCRISRENGAEIIYAFGTSAIRNATNAEVFLDQVDQMLGIHIEVIDGNREAELIYKGVASGYAFPENQLIMDIGGGSTEFIFAGPGGIIKYGSFEIGVSRIFQLFQFSDPMTAEDCKKISDYLENALGNFFGPVSCTTLIGASGSFETFYKLANNCEFPDDEYVTMTIEALRTGLDRIIRSTQKERDANPLIIPIRKKMAPIAAVKTKWVIDKLAIQNLLISPFALKEGVLSELYA